MAIKEQRSHGKDNKTEGQEFTVRTNMQPQRGSKAKGKR